MRDRNKEALFTFMFDEVRRSGGDGEGWIYLSKDTEAKEMAEEFLEWIKQTGRQFDASVKEHNGHFYVWDNQEGFTFTNEKYNPESVNYADVTIQLY